MNATIFDKLFSGGRFALPYLVRFYHEVAGEICVINNNEAVEYDGKHYAVSSFDYTPPGDDGNGATLTITGVDNNLIEWAETADSRLKITVEGVMLEDGSIYPLRSFKHFFGSLSYSDNMSLEFTLGKDDRLEMTFNPYVYDTDNNRGNA